MRQNQTLIYRRYTPYEPVPGEHLAVEPRPFDPESEPPPGGITIKNLYLSFDPYQRGQMRAANDPGSYSQPWIEGHPAIVTTLSTVLKSDNSNFKTGNLVSAMADAGEYATVPAAMVVMTRLIPPPPPGVDIAPSALIGALGIAGLSAYISFNEFVQEPRAGKTIFISAASGGVGQVVGQMAKMNGMKVIGSTGSPEKVDFVVNELGFDAAWDYKTEKTATALARLAPEGLDVYYDNVGGEQLETALTMMKDFGNIGKPLLLTLFKIEILFPLAIKRLASSHVWLIVSSGMVSVYHYPDEEKYGIRTGMNIFLKRLTIKGFICSDPHHLEKYLPTFASDMVGWIAQGKMKTKEEVVVGMDNAVDAMIRMWRGDKFGKMVLKIDEDQV